MKLDPSSHSANKIEDFFFDYQLNYLKKWKTDTEWIYEKFVEGEEMVNV